MLSAALKQQRAVLEGGTPPSTGSASFLLSAQQATDELELEFGVEEELADSPPW